MKKNRVRKSSLSIIVAIALFVAGFPYGQSPNVAFADTATYAASAGFSTTQGANNWSYKAYNTSAGTYSNMTWHADGAFPLGGYWRDASQNDCSVTSQYQHADSTCNSARTWTAPQSGNVRITGTAKKQDVAGGDGVVVAIKKNGTTIWGPQTISYNDATGYTFDIRTNVVASDAIYFLVNMNGNKSNDLTSLNPTVEFAYPGASNTATNGSFEAGTGGTATGWTNGTNHARASDKAFDGGYSLKSTATSTAISSRTITVAANTTYILSAWVYKTNAAGMGYVDFNDLAGEAQVGVGVGDGAGQWTYSSQVWNSGSTTSLTLRCVTDGSPTAAIWFDDVQLVPASSWQLNTSDTSLTLTVSGNKPAISMLKNPGENWNWTPSVTSIPLMSRVDIGGTPYTPNWTYADAALDTSSGTKVTLRFTSSSPNLELKSYWWARPGVGPVEHWMTVENKTGGTITVYPQESMDVNVKGDVSPTLWRFHKESGESDATGIYKNALANGSDYSAWTDTNNDWNGNGYIPLVYLDEANDHGLYVGWEWPEGRIRTTASGSAPVDVNVKAGLNATFKTDVAAGGTFDVPSAYIGAYDGDTDAGSNQFKKWWFTYKAPQSVRSNPKEPFLQMDEQGLQSVYDLTTWGMDAIKWDYGWWPSSDGTGGWRSGEGDWRLGAPQFVDFIDDVFGLTSWSDYGDYLEDEGLSYTNYFLLHDARSNDANALSSTGTNAHPSWFSNRTITNGLSADLGNDDAVDWIKNRLLTVMNANKIATYRSDFEPIALTSGQTNNHKYGVDTQYWNAKGFYEIIDYLYANKADFRYENNGSGGSMKDFATLKRSNVILYTDTPNYDVIRKTFFDSSYAIHPAQMMAPVNPDDYSNGTDDDFGWRSVMLASMNVGSPTATPGDLPGNTEVYMEKYYKMFADKIRPLARNGNLYHVLPRPDGVHWDGVQYFDPAVTGVGTIKGVAFVFKPSDTEGDDKTIFFKGLNPSANYTVQFEDRTGQNTTKYGWELMDNGLSVNITQNKGSDIIWLK